MAHVVGVDLSTKAVDLVKLAEDSNAAEWVRVDLEGETAWERMLGLRDHMPDSGFWEDVYLVAVERPMGFQHHRLDWVVGAFVSCLPWSLRAAHRCWLVQPNEWKAGLGLKAKPTMADFERVFQTAPHWRGDENARDAAFLAMFSRDLNARGKAA